MPVPYGVRLRRKSFGYSTLDGRYVAVRHVVKERGEKVAKWSIHFWSPEGGQAVLGLMDSLTEVRSEICLNEDLYDEAIEKRRRFDALFFITESGYATSGGEFLIEKGKPHRDGIWNLKNSRGKCIHKNLETLSIAMEAAREYLAIIVLEGNQ